jgi:hypothetical protein
MNNTNHRFLSSSSSCATFAFFGYGLIRSTFYPAFHTTHDHSRTYYYMLFSLSTFCATLPSDLAYLKYALTIALISLLTMHTLHIRTYYTRTVHKKAKEVLISLTSGETIYTLESTYTTKAQNSFTF